MKYLIHIVTAPIVWMKKLYNWTMHWSKTKKAPYALFAIAFMESSFFPIPPDILLIPMVVADKNRWVRTAAICTIGSVSGALLGYLIGYSFYEIFGKPIIAAYNLENVVNMIGQKYQANAFLTIFTAAFTPIPYKVITIGAGLFRISLPILVIASTLGRSCRFFMVAGILRIFGKRIADSIEKYFDIFSIIFTILLVGGFIALKHMSK